MLNFEVFLINHTACMYITKFKAFIIPLQFQAILKLDETDENLQWKWWPNDETSSCDISFLHLSGPQFFLVHVCVLRKRRRVVKGRPRPQNLRAGQSRWLVESVRACVCLAAVGSGGLSLSL